jgi:hypothetical protein
LAPNISVLPGLLEAVRALADPKDRQVVPAAIHAHARLIAAAGLKRFRAATLAHRPLLVQSPDHELV